MSPGPWDQVLTERLELRRPVRDDLAELFAISSDPAVWAHYPSLRHTDPMETLANLDAWRSGWEAHGLDTWTVRLRAEPAVIGYGGCSVRGSVWNLGYRLSPAVQGRGLATELARQAIEAAVAVDPDRPVTARLLEHNRSSARVVEKLGFTLVHRGPDLDHPDPAAIRLIYADRPLPGPLG